MPSARIARWFSYSSERIVAGKYCWVNRFLKYLSILLYQGEDFKVCLRWSLSDNCHIFDWLVNQHSRVPKARVLPLE